MRSCMRCGPVALCAAVPELLPGSWAAPGPDTPKDIAPANKNPRNLFIICLLQFVLEHFDCQVRCRQKRWCLRRPMAHRPAILAFKTGTDKAMSSVVPRGNPRLLRFTRQVESSPTSSSAQILQKLKCRTAHSTVRITEVPLSQSSNPLRMRSEEHTSELQSQSNLVC